MPLFFLTKHKISYWNYFFKAGNYNICLSGGWGNGSAGKDTHLKTQISHLDPTCYCSYCMSRFQLNPQYFSLLKLSWVLLFSRLELSEECFKCPQLWVLSGRAGIWEKSLVWGRNVSLRSSSILYIIYTYIYYINILVLEDVVAV